MPTDSERDATTDRLLKAALQPHEAAVSDACLDAETLSAWADGQLYGQDADGIEAHLADCARCQSMLAAFVQSEPAADAPASVEAPAPAPVVVPFRPRRTMRWFAPAAVGTIAASLLIWTAVRRPSDVTPPIQPVAKVGTPATAPPVASTKGDAIANQPRTAVAPPAKRLTTPAEARPAPAAPAPPPAASPAVSPTPSPMTAAAPPPATSAASGAGAVQVTSATELVRTQTPVVTQSVSANFVQTLPRSDRAALGYLLTLPDGGVEFGPPPDAASAPTVQGAAAGAGAGGRGGAGGGAARARGAMAVPQKTTAAARSAPGSVRWQIAPTGALTKTTDAGATWTPVAIEPPAPITSGAAPSASVCWLVGRNGLVLLSTDGSLFVRVAFPEAVDLQSVTAIDARQAAVTTSAGRVFTTTDGGTTWK